MNGHQVWLIPDCYWPEDGTDAPYVSHESVCVLNTGNVDAHLSFTLYFEDREPMAGFSAACAALRTHHVRMDRQVSALGFTVHRGVPYAMKVESSVPVFVQYSRCDTTQQNMAFLSAIPLHI